ncbi:MAG TPA: hypothetical protein VF219_10730, partial [Vicinamibacterales bacterium]
MKILYTADERQDAQLAANAVRGLAQDVMVIWAGRLSDAGRWLSENRDLAAMVVEAEVHNQSCAPLVRHARTLGLTIPILVVVPEAGALPAVVLEAGADEFLLKNQSLSSNLAAIVRRALLRGQTEQRLQALSAENGRLHHNEARLQEALAARVRSHDALEKQLIDAAQTRQKLDGRLAAALTLLQQQDADVETAVERLRTRETELAEATAARRVVEERRAELEQTLHDLVLRTARDKFAAMQQTAQRQSDFETALAEHVARHDALDRDLAAAREELAQADTLLLEAEAQHASAMTRAARAEQQATQDRADFESAKSQEIAARQAVEHDLATLEQRLEERESTLRHTEERHAAELASAD